MLVIKAEIWPHGEVDERFEIARIGITNIGGHQAVADYTVIGIHGRDREEWVTQGVVTSHIRQHGWRPLAIRALTAGGPLALHQEYVSAVVDLLKRG
jgi:hypothetical protein